MKWKLGILAAAFVVAALSHYLLHIPVLTFMASALTLIVLSEILGVATEELSVHVGQNVAGFVNVTLSNLAELIIIFVAVRAGMVELVQAGIVGSIVGNLLLVLGCSIYFGCKKHGTIDLRHHTAALYLNQLFLVLAVLLLPTFFADRIAESNQQPMSAILALMLFGAYIYFYRLSLIDPRFKEIKEQVEHVTHRWGKGKCIAILVATAVGAFLTSEWLVAEVESVGTTLHLSPVLIGFIIIPLLGNIAEHVVAIFAARKKMAELSMSIAVGSAAQVGMVVAPAAVLFGYLTGHPIALHFGDLPLEVLGLSVVATFMVLHDDQWNINEGVMLVALYSAFIVAFAFAH